MGVILLSAGDPSASSGITLRLLLKCDLFEVELGIGGRSSGCGGGGKAID